MPAIATYARIRPQKGKTEAFEVTPDEPEYIKVLVPADPTARGLSRDAKTQYKFKFDQVLDGDVTQEAVFETVGKNICDGFLNGFNATIFAYVEIYNDVPYDLLNAASGGNAKLSKVRIRDIGNSCIVEDVTRHPAPTEETATNIMFVGKTNRSVAKTSMNMKSSRSHSIFTLNMTSQEP
eukprot:gene21231-8096_t